MIMKCKSLGYYKDHNNAKSPVYSTEESACFDLFACFDENYPAYRYIDDKTFYESIPIPPYDFLFLEPNGRLLISTGLVFDIPQGYSIRLHPRSGLALNFGITLLNAEGIIDSDYIDPIKIILYNTSKVTYQILNGEKICQGELVRKRQINFFELPNKPEIKTNRIGGFGSTGK